MNASADNQRENWREIDPGTYNLYFSIIPKICKQKSPIEFIILCDLNIRYRDEIYDLKHGAKALTAGAVLSYM